MYVNVWNKKALDLRRETRVGIEPVNDKQLEMEAQERAVHDENAAAKEVK